MKPAPTVIGVVAGAVLLAFGLALAGFGLYFIDRQFAFQAAIGLKLIYLVSASGLIGVFCISVGSRLAFNRPNRYQSLLPPFGWYALALLFAAFAAGVGYLLLFRRPADSLIPIVMVIAIAALCVKSGRAAAVRGKAGPARPEPAAIPAWPKGWQIGTIGSTSLHVHWSFPLGGLLVSSMSGFRLPEAIYYCGWYTLLIIMHELGHVAAARRLKLHIFSIEIFGLGGLCMVQTPRTTRAAVLLFSAGMLVQVGLLFLAALWVAVFGAPATPFGLCLIRTLTYVNVALLVMNIIPIKTPGALASDGHVLWQLMLHWRRVRGTSLIFPPETKLHQMAAFGNFSTTAGIELFNDDTTPMEFVVGLLVQHLQLEREAAIALMYRIHRDGGLVVPLRSYEHSVSIAAAMTLAASENGHRFVCKAFAESTDAMLL